MKKLWNWLNETSLGKLVQSYVKVFITTVLALFLADGANVFAVSASDARTWLAAGIASVLPPILTALNPKDPRFGLTKNVPTPVVNVATVVEKTPEAVNKLPTRKAAPKKKVSE